MRKDPNPLDEIAASLRYLWRHRGGIELPFVGKVDRLKFKGKELYLDNKIPGLIQDTFDNLNFMVKDGRKPVLCAKRKTAYGWHLVFNLPPGISFGKVRRHREYFQDAANAWINLKWDGKLHMDIHSGQLPNSAPYELGDYPGDLPVPIGVTQEGIEVLDLAESPHLLVAGVPGFGKSNFLHVLIHSLLPRAYIAIIDMKRLEFAYLKNHCALARTEEDSRVMMEALSREMDRRIDLLEKSRVVKIQDYPGELPHIVLVCDEVAEIQDERTIFLVDRIVRLARAVGISAVAATQRPSKKLKVFADDTRDMFLARVCYQMADEISSRMVLGEGCPLAAYLPGIKGRAIYKFGMVEKEVQTMYLPLSEAKRLLKGRTERGWTYEQSSVRLPPR